MNCFDIFKATNGDEKKLKEYENKKDDITKNINYKELWETSNVKFKNLLNYCLWLDPQFYIDEYFITCPKKVMNGIIKTIICKNPQISIIEIKKMLEKRLTHDEYTCLLLQIFADNFTIKNMFYTRNGNRRKKVGIVHCKALNGDFKITYNMYLNRMREIMSDDEIFSNRYFKDIKEYYEKQSKMQAKLQDKKN